MNPERRSVESTQTNALRLSAISLPVAERQGYHQFAIAPLKPGEYLHGWRIASTLAIMPPRFV